MNNELDKLADFYVQEILNCTQRYLERDELLLRKTIRLLLDQYAVKRVIEDRRNVQS